MSKYVRKFLRPFKKIFIWVIKSFQYSIMLWDDGDFDYGYILKILKYKLKRTREHIVNHDIIVDAKSVGEEIAQVESIIDRLYENNYCDKEYEEHNKYWGDINYSGDDIFLSKKAVKEGRQKEERDAIMKIHDKATELEEKDWNDLFDLMKKNMRNWWD